MTMVKPRPRGAAARIEPREPWWAIAARVLLGVAGGYVVSRTAVWCAAAVLTATRIMPRADAVVLAPMAGFVFYLATLIWAFADPRLGRVGFVLAAAQAATFALAWSLT